MGPSAHSNPTFLFLHEGLGSVSLWKDFPQKLSVITGFGCFVYSRAGYGRSTPVTLPRPLDYMTHEALDVLPRVLDKAGVQNCIIVGHSDGASIATIYAGTHQDPRVRGLVLIAPHFFTESKGLSTIRDAKYAYDTGNLREKLARHHNDVDNAFRGWNDAWLDEKFKNWNITKFIERIRVPVLVIQGKEDQYGTMKQVEKLESCLTVDLHKRILDDCGHAPQIEHRIDVLNAISVFIQSI